MASTTASSLSAVLTVLTILAAVWRPHEQWRPQPLLATDRPKFPFGGKRREREPAAPEPTGPDLLDEVAGGRYGGGQTLLPTLGSGTEKSSERKLPRLFPDAHDDAAQLDDAGFDDDLIGWSREEAPAPAPEAEPEHLPAAELEHLPPPPRMAGRPPVGLVPPPPPSMPTPGDANWPREMGMLEAIANMDTAPAAGSDLGAAPPEDSGLWTALSRGGEAASSSLPLDEPVLAPFSDLAPLEPWEQPAAAAAPPVRSWLSFPGEPRAAVTEVEHEHEHEHERTVVEPTEETEARIDDITSFDEHDTESFDPDALEIVDTGPTRDVYDTTSYAAEVIEDEPFDLDALEIVDTDTTAVEHDDATHEPVTDEARAWSTHAHDADVIDEVDEVDGAELDAALAEFDETHDRWTGVRWADPATSSEPAETSTDTPAAPPTFSFALPELSEAWDAFAAREGFDPTSIDDAVAPMHPSPVAAAELEPEAVVAGSWSDIFDIFQAEDDPADPDDDFIDIYDTSEIDAADDEIAEPAFAAFEPAPAFADAPSPMSSDAPADEREPILATVDAPITALPDGDRWASTLLDRLRAVVATPAEPSEALDEFNERFERGLKLRLTDALVVDYLGRGVQMIAPEAEAHLLIGAEGSSLTEMTTVGQQTRPGCGVTDTDMCPAIVQGETLRFDNSSLLDACPFLASNGASACAAVCVPIGEPGTTRGVVHITTLLNAALPDPTVAAVERAATQVGGRLITIGATRRARTSHAEPSDEPATSYADEPVDSHV